jgi:hypothetical protein
MVKKDNLVRRLVTSKYKYDKAFYNLHQCSRVINRYVNGTIKNPLINLDAELRLKMPRTLALKGVLV